MDTKPKPRPKQKPAKKRKVGEMNSCTGKDGAGKKVKLLECQIKVLEDRQIKLSQAFAEQSKALSEVLRTNALLMEKKPVAETKFIKFMVAIDAMMNRLKERLRSLEVEKIEKELDLNFDADFDTCLLREFCQDYNSLASPTTGAQKTTPNEPK